MQLTQDDQGSEQRDHEDVDDGVLDHDPSSLPLLFGREEWRSNLLRRTEPDYEIEKSASEESDQLPGKEHTQHRRVQGVGIRDQDGWSEDDQKNVRKNEIRAPQGHLDDLDDELASRLGHGGVAESTTIPFTRPPSTVSLIVLELTSQEDGDEDLLNRALDGDDSDNTEDSMRSIPKLKEPLKEHQ